MKDKRIALDALKHLIKDGQSIHVGGFMCCGSPLRILDAVLELGRKDLCLICNDTGFADKGVGKWISARMVKTVYASHIGTNRESGRQLNAGLCDFHLIPQGTLVEQIRAAGAGLGGVLTPTGLGTQVAEGKTVIRVDGKDYLLEKPLRADVALLGASIADERGNLWYEGASRNFNPIMATAADLVIAEAERILPVGSLKPEDVHTPHIFVDYLIDGGQADG